MDGYYESKSATLIELDSKKYTPNLAGFLSTCEKNYYLSKKIVESVGALEKKGEQCTFGLAYNNDQSGIVTCTLLEVSAHTVTVEFKQHHPVSEWLPGTCFVVRMYHDAELAEVVEFQGKKHIAVKHAYPNRNMFQRDEKSQHNEFFFDWLQFCMEFGQRLERIDVS